jgi:hypothetical protein
MANEPQIHGLVSYERIDRPPQDIMYKRRMSKYDERIEDAKGSSIKITLTDEKRAANGHLVLRARIDRVAKGE